jgi:pyroglutamyl-peptidase
MPRILVTAFGPYGRFSSNASWLALVELTRDLPTAWQVTTRRYPVEFDTVRQLLARDIGQRPDYALLLGQAPGASCIQLEAIGVNVAGRPEQRPEEYGPLEAGGPPAYRSQAPLAAWANGLREQGLPAIVSYHAGTYLCNAALYWAHYLAEHNRVPMRAAFIHLPLDVSQVVDPPLPTLPASASARAVRWIIEQICDAEGGPGLR